MAQRIRVPGLVDLVLAADPTNSSKSERWMDFCFSVRRASSASPFTTPGRIPPPSSGLRRKSCPNYASAYYPGHGDDEAGVKCIHTPFVRHDGCRDSARPRLPQPRQGSGWGYQNFGGCNLTCPVYHEESMEYWGRFNAIFRHRIAYGKLILTSAAKG
jgi:hypothetical protein